MFYLIMKDGDSRRWWNADAESWGTRQAATRYRSGELRWFAMPPGSRWVGPCDGSES
jgi:hypothetical protein